MRYIDLKLIEPGQCVWVVLFQMGKWQASQGLVDEVTFGVTQGAPATGVHATRYLLHHASTERNSRLLRYSKQIYETEEEAMKVAVRMEEAERDA